MAEQKQPDFDSIKQINVLGDEYWSARDLMPLLGYSLKSWHNFKKAINKAMISFQEAGIPVSDHFYSVVKKVGIGSGAEREIDDFFLTKRACYVIAQNGDPRKKQIAAAQQYFAFAGEVLDDLTRLRLEQERRLQLRLKVADGNKQLSETALRSGVRSENMPLFHDAGYHGMYHMTENQLAAFWNVPPGVAILDIMGPEALAANLFRITATDEKLVRDNVTNETIAIATHHDVGASVRKAIEEIHQQKPENLPRAENIRSLVEAERRKEKKRLKRAEQEQSHPENLQLFGDGEE
jgi:DNA-damage-inducible protein D